MKKLAKVYSGILSVLTVVGMIGYISSVVIQIFSRTFLPTVPSWTEEVARYLFIYSVAVGAGIVVLNDDFARVDIITSRFPAGLKKPYEIACGVLMICFDLYLALFSIPKFVFLKFRMVSTALQIPMQFINFSILLFIALQAIAFAIRIVLILMDVDWKNEIKEEVAS